MPDDDEKAKAIERAARAALEPLRRAQDETAATLEQWGQDVRETIEKAFATSPTVPVRNPTLNDPGFRAELDRLNSLIAEATARPTPKRRAGRNRRKFLPGNEGWLHGLQSVSRAVAAAYLGVRPDTLRKLINEAKNAEGARPDLIVDGPNVKTDFLRDYWRTKSRGTRRQ
jgi:hypothetical protein